ncbi:MAG: peptide chain release factor 2 [Chloroflexi bacterium]|nr:peptide chain release factor 2 [Chloroflexota bacterium]
MQELKGKIVSLQERINNLMVRLDVAGRETKIGQAEEETAQPGFWSDPQKAQATLRWVSKEKRFVETWRKLEKGVADVAALLDISMKEEDASLAGEIGEETEKLTRQVEQLEMQVMLRGEYDARNAILTLSAGVGGTEAQDWAQMLLRMYLRLAERWGYKSEVLDTNPGEEAGIKSAVVAIAGEYAYGYLHSEHGVHRLVRLSPFDADHARHTSFAMVEVMPEAEKDVDVKINPDDLKMEAYRSSGAGGQNVQKVSTAVRITHIPTGIVVTQQSERSQLQNKEIALRLLQSKLLEIELAKKAEERARLKGEHVEAGWGNQIRSYVIHPYKMVKDHRTGYETSNAQAVLDGELDEFIYAYLRHRLGGES